MDELELFIDKVYREPYSLLGNNCIRKSLKIKAKAEELGRRADLIFCFSIVPIKKWLDFRTFNIHLYCEIDDKKVDVSLDPELEKKYCKNSEKKLILPVNISKLRRILTGRTHPERLVLNGVEGSRMNDSISPAAEAKS